MAQVIMEHQQLIPLLPRFNIKMGFGHKSVEQVCQQYGVNTCFFLEICNSYIYEDYTATKDLSLFSLETMVDYLKNTHHYYTAIAFPALEQNIAELISDSELSIEKKDLVFNFFNDYKRNFLEHIQKEEEIILPYILELEIQYRQEKADEYFIRKVKKYSINDFALEHDRLETSLTNLSKLIIQYLPPFENWVLCHRILMDLCRLVKDLTDHGNMEDKVLIPRVSELEHSLLQKNREA